MKRPFDAAIRQYEVKEAKGDGRVEWEHGVKSGLPSVKLLGKTEQQSYTGKNLFDVSRIQAAAQGDRTVWVSDVGPDYLVISEADSYSGSGQCQTGKTLRELAPMLKADISYRLSFVTESASAMIYLHGSGLFWGNGSAMSVTETALDGEVSLYGLRCHDGSQSPGDCRISNIQIEEGSVATAYEPYVGGIPAPNPLYPQDIKANNARIQCTNADGSYDGGEAAAPLLMCAVDGSCRSAYDPQTGEFTNWWDKITLDGSEYWRPTRHTFSDGKVMLGFYLKDVLPEEMNKNASWCNIKAPHRKNQSVLEGAQLICGQNNQILYIYDLEFCDDTLADKGIANWTAYLAEHPLEVWVARNEPEITNIGAQRLTCPTGYGQILQVAGDVPDCPLEVTYLAHGGHVKDAADV